jgi:hypothetical protein
VDCFTQPLEPNNFVLLHLATKKTVKYFVGLVQETGIDGYNTRLMRKQLTCWTFCFQEIEDTAVVDSTDIVLKLRHPVVSGSNRRIVTMIFGMNLSGYSVK